MKLPEKLPFPPAPDRTDTKQLKADEAEKFRTLQKILTIKNKNLVYAVYSTVHHALTERAARAETLPGAHDLKRAQPFLGRFRARSYAFVVPNPWKFALLHLPVVRIALWLVTLRLRTTRTVTRFLVCFDSHARRFRRW